MNAEQIVQMAREFVVKFFQDQGISRVGLEELNYDYDENLWTVTVGYERNWNDASNFGEVDRVCKVLTLTNDGQLIGIQSVE